MIIKPRHNVDSPGFWGLLIRDYIQITNRKLRMRFKTIVIKRKHPDIGNSLESNTMDFYLLLEKQKDIWRSLYKRKINDPEM